MSFIWPYLLLSLFLIPLFVWFYLRLRSKRAEDLANLGPLGTVQDESGRNLGRRRHVPSLIFLGGLTVLLISLARPQMTMSLPRIEGTVILAFDVSNSMIADDLEPSRIEAAKEAARTFVDNQPSTIRIGVVAFGNGGFVVQPPTDLRADVLESIDRLTPQGNTSLGHGIFAGLNAIAGEPLTLDEGAFDPENETVDLSQLEIEDYSSAVIMLLTDGENTGSPDPLAIAQIAAEAGVRVYPVGVGSEEGAIIEVDGFNIVTRLDEVMLENVANLTNGLYYRAADAETLHEIYKNVDLQFTVDPEMMEVTSLFAGFGLILLLVASAFSMVWFGRMP